MLKQLQKRRAAARQQGFTIIEVLIVLAVAGLIMVVVFLAVPALQRSGRNNGLNTSANNVLSAVGTYMSNNGGTTPAATTNPTSAVSGGTVTIGATGSNQETIKVDGGVTNFGIITSATGAITTSNAVGTIQVVAGTAAQCNSTVNGLQTGASVSARSYVVLYTTEKADGTSLLKCVGS